MNFEQDWILYDTLKQKVNNQYKKASFLYSYSEYMDLRIPILKNIMWSYKYDRDNKINHTPVSKVKHFFKIIHLLFVSDKKNNQPKLNKAKSTYDIGIYIDDISLYNVFEKLFYELKKKYKVFAFQFYIKNEGLNKELKDLDIDYYSYADYSNSVRLTFLEKFKAISNALTNDIIFVYYILKARINVIQHIIDAEDLMLLSPKVLMLNASEQSCQGYVISMVAKKHNSFAINSQNGWKGHDPINQDTNFSKWFVHDEFMHHVLVESGVPENQLAITGHPLLDYIKEYKYNNSLDNIIKDKKRIIVLFSSFIYDKEQKEVADFLKSYCKENANTAVLVRLHPSDKKNLGLYEECGFWIQPNSTSGNKFMFSNSLFDLFSVASLSISFGSMVSYQSKWFNVPSVTVEFEDKSILNFVDNETVFHINSIEKLKNYINKEKNNSTVKGESFINSEVPVYMQMYNQINALLLN